MAERSFVAQIEDLRKGEGDVFTGEGILAITKALLSVVWPISNRNFGITRVTDSGTRTRNSICSQN